MKQCILWSGLLGLAVVVCGPRLTHRGFGEEPKGEKWPRIDQSQYAGSAKCAECHQTYYDGWKDSAHNKMIRAPKTEGAGRTIFADFSKESPHRKFEV